MTVEIDQVLKTETKTGLTVGMNKNPLALKSLLEPLATTFYVADLEGGKDKGTESMPPTQKLKIDIQAVLKRLQHS